MTSLLQINSSVTGDASVTNGLSALLVETIGADATVTVRDATALPSLTGPIFAANMTPAADRTPEQAQLAATADAVLDELEAADVLVIGAPIYNFGVPSGLKSWIDLAARAGRTFRYTAQGPEGLVTGKKAYVVTASGGVPAGSGMDHCTTHISLFLNFLGITDVTLIEATGLQSDPGKLAQAQEHIRSLASA